MVLLKGRLFSRRWVRKGSNGAYKGVFQDPPESGQLCRAQGKASEHAVTAGRCWVRIRGKTSYSRLRVHPDGGTTPKTAPGEPSDPGKRDRKQFHSSQY